MDNVKIMIDQIYDKEPESVIVIKENEIPVAIMFKDDWQSDRLTHIRNKCKDYTPSAFIERGDIPMIGTVFYIDLCKCEKAGVY